MERSNVLFYVKDFFYFIKNPYSVKQYEKINMKNIFFLFLIFFTFTILLQLIIDFSTNLLLYYDVISLPIHRGDGKRDFFHFFIVPCVIGVVFEESIYRLPLKFSSFNISVSILIMWIDFPLNHFLISTNKHFSDISNIKLIIIKVLIIISIGFILNQKKIRCILQNFWTNYFKWIFYSFSLFFGLLHITNYILTLSLVLLSPLICFGSIFSGLVFSFLRVKYGFIYCLLFHFLYNSILYLLILFT